jgi:hypothetical protein
MQPEHAGRRSRGLKGLVTSAGSATLGLLSWKRARALPVELELAELSGCAHIKAGAPAALGEGEDEGSLDDALCAALPSSAADDQARASSLQQDEPAQHAPPAAGASAQGHERQRALGQQLELLQEEPAPRQPSRADSPAASASAAPQQVIRGWRQGTSARPPRQAAALRSTSPTQPCMR